MRETPVEILAPAGSFESMKAAVAAGADAVYIGGSRFGARAYADNPGEDRLLEAIDYAHLHGCRLYMTVNTLMKEQEMAELYDYLLPYYKKGLDAVIVQDMGVFSYIRKHFPDLPVHASTQMTITGVYGAKLLKELGAERIVTARELSLKEIEKIHQEVDIEIESFVHGALCYCYSGQCLFSSLIGGRSGNRGRCAQTCRLPFDVKRDEKVLNKKDEHYVLSLKDLCTLDLIPDMIEAGIYSMKIEGRMKSPRYTAGVVSVYRKYVDLYLKSGRKGYRVEEADRKLLLDLFDRGGQTDGYYKRHNGRDMVVWKEKPSFREGNQEMFQYLDEHFVEKQVKEPVTGQIYLEQGQASSFVLTCHETTVSVTGPVVLEALNQPMSEEKIRKQLNKTGNTPFEFKELEIIITGRGFLPVQAVNELRRNGLEALEEARLKEFWRETPWCGEEKRQSGGDKPQGGEKRIFVSLERPDALEEVVKNPDVKRIYIDSAEFEPSSWKEAAERCHEADRQCMLTMPHIFRTEAIRFFTRHHRELMEAGFDGLLIRSLEEVQYVKEHQIDLPMVFDFGMYGMNDAAEAMMRELGASELTWPAELNSRELEGLSAPGELLIYGRLPMMVTAQCLHQGTEQCDQVPGTLFLKDRMGKEFPVKNHCRFCYNTVYNAASLSLLGMEDMVKRLRPSAVRLQFTTEEPAETGRILRCFADSFLRGIKAEQPVSDFTRGHFKRGVE